VACGRLQKNNDETGQIRFMAVDNLHQSKGLGNMIVSFLEEEGKKIGLKKIELQARENAVDFYKKAGGPYATRDQVKKIGKCWLEQNFQKQVDRLEEENESSYCQTMERNLEEHVELQRSTSPTSH
jgi:N-acetylglutamate synthase-like GNAT family acetyltransferase